MKDTFEQFYEMLKLDREKSTFSKESTFENRYEELYKEVIELKEAIEKNDFKNLEEELGDVLWDVLFLIIIAEEKKICDLKTIIENSMAKLKRRKSSIFDGRKITREQEIEEWIAAKRLEKNL